MGCMNRLATEKRITVVSALVEGVSVNATCRMIVVAAKHTILKLQKDLGCTAAAYHGERVRNLRVPRVQCDEIWAFVYPESRNSPATCIGCRTGVFSGKPDPKHIITSFVERSNLSRRVHKPLRSPLRLRPDSRTKYGDYRN